jgi:hypothetical protein
MRIHTGAARPAGGELRTRVSAREDHLSDALDGGRQPAAALARSLALTVREYAKHLAASRTEPFRKQSRLTKCRLSPR